MQLTTKEIESAILELPAEERVRLLEMLLSSLEAQPSMHQSWLELAHKRRDEVRYGQVAMVPGDQAIARVRQRLK
jgi:putative addiction module component (TIGR02574 family)